MESPRPYSCFVGADFIGGDFSYGGGSFAGITLENLELENLGQVKKIEQSKDDTLLLIDDGANSDEIEDRCEQLRDSIADTKSDYEKEKMQVKESRCDSTLNDSPPITWTLPESGRKASDRIGTTFALVPEKRLPCHSRGDYEIQ